MAGTKRSKYGASALDDTAAGSRFQIGSGPVPTCTLRPTDRHIRTLLSVGQRGEKFAEATMATHSWLEAQLLGFDLLEWGILIAAVLVPVSVAGLMLS